ncbi:MAG: RNA methyltransferase [Myxococcota bacterium]|nr:RNA methyltransferase [Myxococcota bacterium]
MRRTTPGVSAVGGWAARAEAHDQEKVIRALEPLVTELRRQRLREVIGRRLVSVGVALDAPYDPHNGAAVLRSCEAFGVQRLHVVERKGTPFAVAHTVARGAEKWIDVRRHPEPWSFLDWASQSKTTLVAAHPDGELPPEELAAMPRVAIVLGNERDGIRHELAAACLTRVRVPMRGFVESLNMSVTAAILLYAATRGRTGDLAPAAQRRLYARGLYLSVAHAENILVAAGI